MKKSGTSQSMLLPIAILMAFAVLAGLFTETLTVHAACIISMMTVMALFAASILIEFSHTSWDYLADDSERDFY